MFFYNFLLPFTQIRFAFQWMSLKTYTHFLSSTFYMSMSWFMNISCPI